MTKTFREAYKELESRPVPDERFKSPRAGDRLHEESAPPAKEENQSHEEDFNRPLGAVARTPRSDDQT